MPRQPKPWLRAERKAWFARIGGKQVRLCSEEEGHAEAVKRFHRLMAERASGSTERPKASVAVLTEQFLRAIAEQLKPSTVGWYQTHLQSFVDHAGRLQASAVQPEHVRQWLAAHKWSPSTRRGAITAVKRCWAWGADNGYVARGTLDEVRRPKMAARAVMNPDDLPRVMAAIRSATFRDFVVGLLETGCRPSELAGATAADFDASTAALTVRGKTGERVVYLAEVGKQLLARLAEAFPEGPLFRNRRGRAWVRNAWRCGFRRIRARSGVKGATAYGCRHLFATLAIARGVDSLLVAAMLGHTGTRMLQEHYHRPQPETLRRAAEQATRAAG